MDNWRLRDSAGIVITLVAILYAASTVDGLAQALVALVGVVVALLWIGRFFFEGYADIVTS